MKIGRRQELTVREQVDGGFGLGDAEQSVFLDARLAPQGTSVGDVLEVFVQSDRSGNPEAIFDIPYAERGEFALLQVIDRAPHGAYLDWGLERDLFMPNFLQFGRIEIGDKVVVAIDVDDRGRLFASNRLVDYFDTDFSGLEVGLEVSLAVYGFNDIGVKVIVDGQYTGLVYKDQLFEEAEIGGELTGWIAAIRDDGKLDITLRRTGRQGTRDARQMVLDALEDGDGFLDLTDKSDPAVIRERLQISKKQFKKAVGALYKERLVVLSPNGIRRA